MSRALFVARAARRSGGFTLVELMVGLAVGLFVSVIAISLFVSSRKLQAVNSSSNRMAENARLAFDLLHKDLRLVGFRGCSDDFTRDPDSVLNPSGNAFIADASGIRGYVGTGSGFNPTLPSALLAVTPTPPRNNSDVISVRVPVDAASLGLVASMASNTSALDVGTNTGTANLIDSGDVVMLANCKRGVLFQVTGSAAPGTTGLLPHAAGGAFYPGNSNADLGFRYNKSDSAVYRMQTRHYYVAPSSAATRAGTFSLWRLTVPAPAGRSAAEEIVPGIERLNVTYGVEASAVPDRAVDRYVTAANVPAADWSNVLSARIQMLAATTDNGTAQAASSVAFAGGTVSAGDKRLREVFTEVVAFRNQLR